MSKVARDDADPDSEILSIDDYNFAIVECKFTIENRHDVFYYGSRAIRARCNNATLPV